MADDLTCCPRWVYVMPKLRLHTIMRAHANCSAVATSENQGATAQMASKSFWITDRRSDTCCTTCDPSRYWAGGAGAWGEAPTRRGHSKR